MTAPLALRVGARARIAGADYVLRKVDGRYLFEPAPDRGRGAARAVVRRPLEYDYEYGLRPR